MWGLPMFDLRDAAGIMRELAECRRVYGDRYIRISGFDSTPGWESLRLSFIANRPKQEPGFRLDRQETRGRNLRYATHSYAVERPEGERYGSRSRPPMQSPWIRRRPIRSTCVASSRMSKSRRCWSSSIAN